MLPWWQNFWITIVTTATATRMAKSSRITLALSSISLGTTVIPRRNWKPWLKTYAKFWGVNKVKMVNEHCDE